MKTLSWNCCGLRTPGAIRAVRKLIKSEAPTVVFLMETKKKAIDIQRLRRLEGYDCVFAVDCAGDGNRKAGGLALYWKSNLDLSISSYSLNHIQFTVPIDHANKTATLTGFYGFPEKQHKWKSRQLLRNLKSSGNSPWMCFGDFNEITCQEDKIGGLPWTPQQSEDFLNAIDACNLLDLGHSHPIYTWSNNRAAPNHIEERLDRALANREW